MKIHLLVTMAGQGERFKAAGHQVPKPMVCVNGRPIISHLLEVFPANWPKHFVMNVSHIHSPLPAYLKANWPNAEIAFIPVNCEGPLKAVEEGLKNIPEDDPVLVTYCDYSMSWSATQFEEFVSQSGCDACVISYRGPYPHFLISTKVAFSRTEYDRVLEIKEKGPFTSNYEEEFASSGGYYFRTARLLKKACELQKTLNLHYEGEYFTSLAIQALLVDDPKTDVRIFEIPHFIQLGSPEYADTFCDRPPQRDSTQP